MVGRLENNWKGVGRGRANAAVSQLKKQLIAAQVGYANGTSLCALMRRKVGRAVSELRTAYCPNGAIDVVASRIPITVGSRASVRAC